MELQPTMLPRAYRVALGVDVLDQALGPQGTRPGLKTSRWASLLSSYLTTNLKRASYLEMSTERSPVWSTSYPFAPPLETRLPRGQGSESLPTKIVGQRPVQQDLRASRASRYRQKRSLFWSK
jgi:hypothetical protein